jgi:SAM-dependent methyltransferase
MSEQPHMYTDLADWWPILSQPADYEEEAGIFTRAIQSLLPGARTMLELGSGGGNNASFLKKHFALTLVDRAPGMLVVSQRLNPDLPHHQGDMRTVRLGQTFDVVFIHDAIMYMESEADLRQAIQTAALHTRPGGMALLVPDMMRETFRPETSHGGHDGIDVVKTLPEYDPVLARRSMRYLEWTYDPDPSDTAYICEFAYLLREAPDRVEVVHDRHVNGIFPRATWLRVMEEAGFQARLLPFDHSEVEPGMTEMVAGIRGL